MMNLKENLVKLASEQIIINVGVLNNIQNYNFRKKKNEHLWSVLEANPISFFWVPPVDRKFSVIFTSKIAVRLFFKEVDINSFDLSNMENISGVGEETASEIESYLIKIIDAKISYPQTEGLKYLLEESNFSKKSTVYIFTAENGKTETTLKNFTTIPYNTEVIHLYKLSPYQSNFLNNLFKNQEHKKMFVFNCASGQVLTEAVSQLQTYFQCETAERLPNFIYFTAKKSSTLGVLAALNLVDRNLI